MARSFIPNAPYVLPFVATEGQRPGSIPALGNAQGKDPPDGKGLKARHQIAGEHDHRWIGLSALSVFSPAILGRRSFLALAQAGMGPGLWPAFWICPIYPLAEPGLPVLSLLWLIRLLRFNPGYPRGLGNPWAGGHDITGVLLHA